MRRRRGVIIAAMLMVMPVTAHATEIPADIQAINQEVEEETNVSRYLLAGLEYSESGFNERAVNNAGTCYGLCQVYKKFHLSRMERLGVEDLFDKRGNIRVAADLLAELFEQYDDLGMVLLLYGGASDRAKARYLEDGTLPKWAQRIIDKSLEFEKEDENDRTERTADAERDQDDGSDGQDDHSGNVSCGD